MSSRKLELYGDAEAKEFRKFFIVDE